MPPVDNDTRHEARRQNVPMKKVEAVHTKNSSVLRGEYLQKSHARKNTQNPPMIWGVEVNKYLLSSKDVKNDITNCAIFKMPGSVFKYPVLRTSAEVEVVVVVVRVIVTAWLILQKNGNEKTS